MATVPDDQIPTVQQEPLPGRAIPRFSDAASPAEFGFGVGQGLGQLGSDLGQMQDRQRAAAKQAQDKANADADRVQSAKYQLGINDIVTGAFYGKDPNDPNAIYRQQGQALATLPQDAVQRISGQINDLLKDAPPHIQAMLAEHVTNTLDKANLDAHRYAFEQSNREAVETFSNTISQHVALAALDFRDPSNYSNHKDAILLAGQSLAEKGGKDAIKAYNDGGYRRDLDKLNESLIGGHLAAGDIRGAQKALDAHASDLSSGEIHESLQNRITAAGDRIDNLNRSASADRIADQRAAAMAGLPGWEKLASPGDYAIVHRGDAQTQMQTVAKLAAAGQAEKQFDNMPIADVIKARQDAQVTTAKPGAAADLEAERMIDRAAVNSITRRQKDPAQFAIDSGKGWQPINFDNSKDAVAQLRSRANTAPEIAKQLQVRVPLMTQPEAQQLATQLDNSSPAEKLKTLTQLHSSLPTQGAYFSVLQQIMPHSPVTAIVGQKLDNPSEWDNQTPPWYSAAHAPNPADGQTILAGEALLNPQGGAKQGVEGEAKGSKFPLPPDDHGQGLRANFAKATQGMFADRAPLEEAHYSAFRDAYAALSEKAGDYSGARVDPARAKEALRIAVGTPVTFNRSQVVPPAGMDPSTFQTNVEAAVAKAAKSYKAPAGWADAIHGYQLREEGRVGSGRYTLVDGNKALTRPDDPSQPFTIDLSR